ncbi:hypothetical protein KO465_05190 [Candidatus Micrarchaeota archaeon]|nr:hypothetical protein [Candidatus Micrarchaeota archaeon]
MDEREIERLIEQKMDEKFRYLGNDSNFRDALERGMKELFGTYSNSYEMENLVKEMVLKALRDYNVQEEIKRIVKD